MMNGEIYIGSRDEYINNKITVDKECWMREKAQIFINNEGCLETDLINIYYILDEQGTVHSYSPEFQGSNYYLKPFIKLTEVPKDYHIGDKFKIGNSRFVWEYLGDNIGISTKLYGPYSQESVNVTIAVFNEELKEG